MLGTVLDGTYRSYVQNLHLCCLLHELQSTLLKRGSCRELCRGVLDWLLRGILGVETIAHMTLSHVV